MKYILIIFIFLYALNPLFSQKDSSQFYNKTLSNNNFSVELGGKGFLYSVGYERILLRSEKLLLTGSLNLSYVPFAGIVPIGINILAGEQRNKLLFGLCATNFFDFTPYPKNKQEREKIKAAGKYYEPPYVFYFVPSVGYRRYLKKDNSLSVAFTPLIYKPINRDGSSIASQLDAIMWFGINYNFKF